jgi:hypothetical protein
MRLLALQPLIDYKKFKVYRFLNTFCTTKQLGVLFYFCNVSDINE